MHNPNVKIHSVHPPLSAGEGGLDPQPNFQKGGGLTRSQLLEGVTGKEGVTFLGGMVLQFSHKKFSNKKFSH